MPESRDERAKRILTRWDALKQQRASFDTNYLKPLQRYVLPNNGYFHDQESGDTAGRIRGQDIINAHPQRAHRVLTAGIHGGLTSPYRQWFDLTLDDPRLAELPAVKAHLEYRKRLYYLVFATSNFYRQKHIFDGDTAGFGTAYMMIESDRDSVANFKTLPMGSYWLAENYRGVVDTLYRWMEMTADHLVDQFDKESLDNKVLDRLNEGGNDQKFEVLHAVQPRRDRVSGRVDNMNMPWESVYIILDKGAAKDKDGQGSGILRESGYEQFPGVPGRWFVVGSEVYGRAPGMDVLPESRRLQEMEADLALIHEKMAKPPIVKPAAMKQPINDLPGGVTPWDGTLQEKPDRLYDFNPDPRGLQEDIRKAENAINQAFFVDVFLMSLGATYGQPPTAEEVVERRAEKLLMLGPIVEGQDSETLQPLIDRVDYLAGEAGLIPEPPRELIGQQIKVTLLGPLAQAQRAAKAQGLRAVNAHVRELAGAVGEVLDLYDADEAFRQFVEGVGVSAKIIRDPETVARIREQRAAQARAQAQAAETQMALDAAGRAAGAAKTASGADPEVINRLMEQMGAA